MHPRLAWIYVCALAEMMGENRMFAPVTDIEDVHRAEGAPTLERLASLLLADEPPASVSDPVATATASYVHVALDEVVPTGLGRVPIKTLIGFRERHRDELGAFHAHLDTLGTALGRIAEIPDDAARLEHIRALYDRETRPLVRSLNRALRSAGVDAGAGTLLVKIDGSSLTGSVLGAAAFATGAPAVLTAAGIAAAVVPTVVSSVRRRRQQRGESPVAYLVAARKDLGTSMLRRVLRT